MSAKLDEVVDEVVPEVQSDEELPAEYHGLTNDSRAVAEVPAFQTRAPMVDHVLSERGDNRLMVPTAMDFPRWSRDSFGCRHLCAAIFMLSFASPGHWH